MKIAFASFGCKVNQSEIDSMVAKLPVYGHEYTKWPDEADILIVNTCAVTDKAQKDGEKFLIRAKQNNPSLLIAVTGCLAELLKEKLGADILVLNREKESLLDKLPVGESRNIMPPRTHTRTFIKIQDGCDCNCTYCIIPSLRGKPVSKPAEIIINEASAALELGSKEIVLTGIHTGIYGKDTGNVAFNDLLKALVVLKGDFRVRLSSLYVNEITSELISTVQASKGIVCPHFHISLQSGSQEILKKMGRKYSPEEFERIVHAMRQALPEATIGADIITGFPGETDALFKETVALLDRVRPDFLHIFPYSPRPNTPAASFEGQVPHKIKQERAKLLRKLAETYQKESLKKLSGKTVRILTERDAKGHTDSFHLIRLPEDTPVNEFIYITIHDNSAED